MLDHGGDLDAAIARFGGAGDGWVDLSTGINPRPYPLPDIPPRAWATLPTRSDIAAVCEVARQSYGTAAEVVATSGAQAAIQVVPRLVAPGQARILAPTYNEHAAALRVAGWSVEECNCLGHLNGADLAVVVNPNNPDGRRHDPQALLGVSETVGLLVVDESFCDADPGLSLAGALRNDSANILVQRSFGKFFGLAGLRLGFILAGRRLADQVRALVGPWQISGPAAAVGTVALADEVWRMETIARLQQDAARLDGSAELAGWRLVGGTSLFRTYETRDARAAQMALAAERIWSRVFPYSDTWIRLGNPGDETAWARLEDALRSA